MKTRTITVTVETDAPDEIIHQLAGMMLPQVEALTDELGYHEYENARIRVGKIQATTAQLEAAVDCLQRLVTVMNDPNAAGTNNERRWMGCPDWSDIDTATALLRKIIKE